VDKLLAALSRQHTALFVSKTYGPALVTALGQFNSTDYNLAINLRFITHVCSWLQKDYPIAPEKSADWVRAGQLPCQCQFCQRVNQFLPDPDQGKLCIDKTLKRNLSHVELMANQHKIDLRIEIVRLKSKFQGNIYKTQRQYEVKLGLFNEAQKIIATLQGLN